MKPHHVARGLAWFGIALGIAELLKPHAVARASGLDGQERLLQVFGAREIASGALILAARDPQSWLWTRVVGDALDGIVLSAAVANGSSRQRQRALVATAAVAPVVALDALYMRRPL